MTREDEMIEAYSAEADSLEGVSCAAASGSLRPDSEGFWWCLKKGRWSIGTVKLGQWEMGEAEEITLFLTQGGCYRRCDTINTRKDEGVRFFRATPPFKAENSVICKPAGDMQTPDFPQT